MYFAKIILFAVSGNAVNIATDRAKGKNLAILVAMKTGKCSIDGISYLDPLRTRSYHKGEDPCNPLYWYPRNIPEYCYDRKFNVPINPGSPSLPMSPLPMPLPVPVPSPLLPPVPAPLPVLPPIPYGVPIAPSSPMLPVALPSLLPSSPYLPSMYSSGPYPYNPYASNTPQSGMVPGLPGLVTRDGGINILPFSDAYSDLIENHKSQMIRRKLQKLIDEYENFPNARRYRQLKKYARRNM